MSKWYVTCNGKSKFDWNYKSTPDFTVRKAGGLWLCYERKTKEVKSDIVKEQERLYKRLKREYLKSLMPVSSKVDVEDTLTETDKLQNITRKKTVQLLQGLKCAPNYERIYAS